MFHQVEGLVIDKTANVGHLRWILEEFCKAFFEVDSVTMRFRPSFFPFTEPSFEVDIQCDRTSGPIVKFGEGTDWMEILGCGMVHPNVLRAGGLDPDEYQGFACLDRIAMLKYGPAAGFPRCPLDKPLWLPSARRADPVRRPDEQAVERCRCGRTCKGSVLHQLLPLPRLPAGHRCAGQRVGR
jgi:hypothetical protein